MVYLEYRRLRQRKQDERVESRYIGDRLYGL